MCRSAIARTIKRSAAAAASAIGACCVASLSVLPAAAQQPVAPVVPEGSNLLGDLGGLRPAMDDRGISLNLSETSEILGNPTGGRAQGVIYEGLTQLGLGVDLAKTIGLPGGSLNITAFQIHGRGLSANYLQNLNTTSGIEADRATRLFEFWYQQAFLDGKIDLRIGQEAADQEFIISQYAGLFVNASFGWPTLAAVNLPSGGAAYPLATPAVRLRLKPSDVVTALVAVYNGNPAGNGGGDPQHRDASGTSFATADGAFAIGEVQFRVDQGDGGTGLPGVYKFGAWYETDQLPNPFYDAGGVPPDGPLPGEPALRHNDWSLYAVADQLVWSPPGSPKGAGVGVFARIMGAPDDRSVVDFFIDGGIDYQNPFGRDGDTVGVGVGWARIGGAVRAGEAAFAAQSGGSFGVRTSETVIELTYQTQLFGWCVVQPDFQYIVNPGGGILAPTGTRLLGDAAVVGVRTVITF